MRECEMEVLLCKA